jgi:Malectin domain
MGSTVDFTRESRELQAILDSGIFDRSPALAQLLSYVCAKHFEGTADQIKEYSVAVDALGRPPEFDPKRDSIIRVQFHRLRERLNEYYSGDGASHPVQIVIPQGQYAPRFVFKHGADDLEASPASSRNDLAAERTAEPIGLGEASIAGVAPPETPAPETTVPASPAKKKFSYKLLVAAAALALILIAGVIVFAKLKSEPKASPVPPVASTGDSVRILAGLTEGSYTDGYGRIWVSDRYFQGGTVVGVANHPIWGTRDPRLYQSRRQGEFRYDIPLSPGNYEMRLYFAETHFGDTNPAGYGGENSRIFGISLNGNSIRPRLNVAGEAGVNAACVKVFRGVSPASDGAIHLSFTKIVSEPFINGIEITPGLPDRLAPILLISQPRAYTDAEGRVWQPDRIAAGGQVVTRTPDVEGAADPQLYAGERFGNFSYTIPVTPGRYTVVLHMAERWVGPDQPGRGSGTGARVFDVLCNGVALQRDLDVYSKAGANRVLTQTFRGIEPNHQGNIVLSFVPNKNFPIINALEVINTSN